MSQNSTLLIHEVASIKNGSLVNELFCAFKATANKFGDTQKSKKLTNSVCNIAVRKVVGMVLKKRKEIVENFCQVCAK